MTEQEPEYIEAAPFTYGPGFSEGCFVQCPKCGRHIPSGYDGFSSQKEADTYALQECGCQEQENTPAPDNQPQRPEHSEPEIGFCRYCGQAQSVSGCKNKAEAEEHATKVCQCPEAQLYCERLKAEQRRADALREAGNNIDDLFGSGAAGRGEPSICEEALELLKTGAALVYDHKIVSQQIVLTYTTRAKIGRNKNGNLTIERKDTTSSKLEV